MEQEEKARRQGLLETEDEVTSSTPPIQPSVCACSNLCIALSLSLPLPLSNCLPPPKVREAEAARGTLETTLAQLEHSLRGKREVLLSNPGPLTLNP